MFVSLQINIMEPMCTFKDEEENAMHNTVVIFSSTDTFTLKQVKVNVSEQSVLLTAICVESAALLQWYLCVCVFFSLGYVCSVWKFWTGCGGSTPGLCSVWTVLPPLLC